MSSSSSPIELFDPGCGVLVTRIQILEEAVFHLALILVRKAQIHLFSPHL